MASNTSTVGPNGRYSRDSFDRFGDDLSELILSYLSVREKRSLECVAKQWKRLIHNKTFELHFYRPGSEYTDIEDEMDGFRLDPREGHFYNSRRLEALLKKCTNIRKLVFTDNQIDGLLITIIAKYCPHLESISLIGCHMTRDTLQHFGRVLGPKITTMDCSGQEFCFTGEREVFWGFISREKELLNKCPNIEKLVCEELSVFANKEQNFLPKLKSLKTSIDSENYMILDDLIAKYGKQLVSLELTDRGKEYDEDLMLSNEEFVAILGYISSLVVLTRFKITIDETVENWNDIDIESDTDVDIEPQLTAIGTKCPKLERMVIITEPITSKGKLMKGFVDFNALKRLDLAIEGVGESMLIADMGLKQNLKHLSIQSFGMSEQMFVNISRFVPNLCSLRLVTMEELSDSLLQSLSGLRFLREVSLTGEGLEEGPLKNITDNGVIQLLDNCPELNKIEFSSGISITVQTVTKLMSFARKQPKRLIQFIADGVEDSQPIEEFINACDDMPKNLKIKVTKEKRTTRPDITDLASNFNNCLI